MDRKAEILLEIGIVKELNKLDIITEEELVQIIDMLKDK